MININGQMLFHLSNLNKENVRISNSLATGNILQNGSDDTSVFSQLLYIEDKSRAYTGVQNQIDSSTVLNDSSDSALALAKLQLELVTQELIKSVNSGVSPSDKLAMAATVEGIRDTFFNFANTNIKSEYTFAGSDSTIQPFVKDEITGKITYVGDNALKQTTVEINNYRDSGTTGFDAFMYTSDTARATESLEFLATERITDTDGNTWGFSETSGVGEKLDFFATDTITDNTGAVWTVNALDSTLENTVGGVTTSIDLVKFNGGYQLKDNLSSGTTNAAGAAVTSFTAAPAGGATSEIRQYDKYGNLTGEVLGVTGTGTEVDPYVTAALPANSPLTLETKHSIFDDLDTIITALKGVDAAGAPITVAEQNDIIREMQGKVTEYSNALSIAHSELGSRSRVIEDASVNISAKLTNLDILAVQTGKADPTKLALEATSLQITYTTIYSTIARMQSLNLVNFLN